LLAISLVLIFDEHKKGKLLWATIIFCLSGLFGIITLGTPLVPGGSSSAFSVLFPALSGLFGISGLLLSLFDDTASLPPQKPDISLKLNGASVNTSSLLGTLSGMAVGLLPGLGSANAAALLLLITGNQKNENNDKLYIVTTSAIQASDTLFGVTALYFIEKSRSGASVAIQSVLGQINPWQVLIIILVMGLVGFLSRLIILNSWQFFIKAINFFNYQSLTIAVIIFITILVLLTTGFWGLMVLLAATSLGILPPTIGVRRSQMMGFFLVPVMLFFSGLQEPIVSVLHLQAKISPAPIVSISQIAQSLVISFSTALIAYFMGNFYRKFKKF
jgi:putative membrane protein